MAPLANGIDNYQPAPLDYPAVISTGEIIKQRFGKQRDSGSIYS